MTDLAPHLGHYLKAHLLNERKCSHHTVRNYTDCFRMFVVFAAEHYRIRPCKLQIEHLSVSVVLEFLDCLEHNRNNTASSRNIRLAAIKSFFRYLEYRLVSCLDQARQIRAIPQKRAEKPLIDWLDRDEIQAVLNAPCAMTTAAVRDRAMLHVCYTAALRVSELVALSLDSFSNSDRPSLRVLGKGRRMRELPLWRETVELLDHWLAVRPQVNNQWLFLNARGRQLSADGFTYILGRHVETATDVAPSLRDKKVTPHVLRHSCAMAILHATKDVRKVSLWLGHEHLKTTEVYLRASPAEKIQILQSGESPSIKPGNFTGVQDELLKMLSGH